MALSAKARRREATKVPRAAFCTGCGNVFGKMLQLIEHRRLHRCGGRFLPPEERAMVDKLRLERERIERLLREGE